MDNSKVYNAANKLYFFIGENINFKDKPKWGIDTLEDLCQETIKEIQEYRQDHNIRKINE